MSEFDDVYATIKQTVTEVIGAQGGTCVRLDDFRPAGRISSRLIGELQSASLCVADLTGNNPNVMWELGFVMALQKPTVIVKQQIAGLPFDLKDMQSIEYKRSFLNDTLAKPLRRMLVDTLGSVPAIGKSEGSRIGTDERLIGTLLTEIAQLKQIVNEAVRGWNPSGTISTGKESNSLVGCWESLESGSHIYTRIVNGELVSPYCYGDNSKLTGIYYGWRRIGEYWFARFRWLEQSIAGFAFLRQDSLDVLNGAWWSRDQNEQPPTAPPARDGVQATWRRISGGQEPEWALECFSRIQQVGLPRSFKS